VAGKVHIKPVGLAWQVLLDDHVVATFDMVGQAFDLAAMLESSPRERKAVGV
jgi:hypothetical protein